MKNYLAFLIPIVAFVLAGITFAAEVVIRPYKCAYDGSCVPAPEDHACVDLQGDGICDLTRIPWKRID
jgi:hypothetical protein